MICHLIKPCNHPLHGVIVELPTASSSVIDMRAITAASADNLRWEEVPDVAAQPGEVVIEVVTAGVNRADVLQAAGNYPPPPGASDVMGLDVSGRIAEVGENVAEWSVGDEVCALLAGGGYAERVAVPAAQVMPVPDGVELPVGGAAGGGGVKGPEYLCP